MSQIGTGCTSVSQLVQCRVKWRFTKSRFVELFNAFYSVQRFYMRNRRKFILKLRRTTWTGWETVELDFRASPSFLCRLAPYRRRNGPKPIRCQTKNTPLDLPHNFCPDTSVEHIFISRPHEMSREFTVCNWTQWNWKKGPLMHPNQVQLPAENMSAIFVVEDVKFASVSFNIWRNRRGINVHSKNWLGKRTGNNFLALITDR